MEQNSQIDICKSHEHYKILLSHDAIIGEYAIPLAKKHRKLSTIQQQSAINHGETYYFKRIHQVAELILREWAKRNYYRPN